MSLGQLVDATQPEILKASVYSMNALAGTWIQADLAVAVLNIYLLNAATVSAYTIHVPALTMYKYQPNKSKMSVKL